MLGQRQGIEVPWPWSSMELHITAELQTMPAAGAARWELSALHTAIMV